MKKTSSKLLSLAMVLVMVLSMVACEPTQTENPTNKDLYTNETGYPICSETITLTVSGIQGNTTDWNNTYFVKYVEEKLGIKRECTPFPKDAASTQYSTMIASQSMPDIMVNMGIDKGQVNGDGADGYWLDISEYLDIMPNLKAKLEKYPEWAAYMKDPDGSIYGLNRTAPSVFSNSRGTINYNKTLVSAAYSGEIKTIEDFYNALKAVKAMYPDKTPLAVTFDAAPAYNVDIILRTAFGIEFNDNSYMLVEGKDGKVELGELSDNYRAYLTWMNKLYDEGLLVYDPDLSANAYKANVKEGDYIFWSVAGSSGLTLTDYSDIGIIAALTSQYQPEPTYILNPGVTTNARIFINANTENPKAVCRLIDFLCSPEGEILAVYGEEGKTYDVVEDAFGLTNYVVDAYADTENYASISAWQQQVIAPYQAFALNWGWLAEQLDSLDDATLTQMANTAEYNYQWAAKTLLELRKCNVKVAPAPQVYDSSVGSLRSAYAADLTSYLKLAKVSFITGELDITKESAWNEFTTKAGNMWNVLQPYEQAAWDAMGK